MATPPDPIATPPEWAWWEFDIDDVTADKGNVRKEITDAVDPDLTRFLHEQDGKLIVYHGWADALVVPQPTVQYYRDVVDNERPTCAFPERAVYTSPAGGADDPANWVAGNFTCR